MGIGSTVVFVLEAEVIDRIEGDSTVWEQEPLRSLLLMVNLPLITTLVWQPMDTLNRLYLEDLWVSAKAPWKVW